MDRPTRILICGQPFAIDWVSRHGRKLHEDDDEYWALGSTAVAEQRLIIRAVDQGRHQERDTVVHEILHAIMTMTAQTDRFGEDKDEAKANREAVVDATATALLAVLRENPALLVWLTEELE